VYLLIILLSILCFPNISFSFDRRTDTAVWDPSGDTPPSNLCDQPRPIFDLPKAAMWDSLCDNKVRQEESDNDDSSYFDFDFEPIPEGDDPYFAQPGDDVELWSPREWNPYEEDFREAKRNWSKDLAFWIVYNWVQIYRSGQGQSIYLDYQVMRDIAMNGDYFGEALEQCLAKDIYNDFSNNSNLVNSENYERLLHWNAGHLRDCYRRVR
jgi:hypothetical protein